MQGRNALIVGLVHGVLGAAYVAIFAAAVFGALEKADMSTAAVVLVSVLYFGGAALFEYYVVHTLIKYFLKMGSNLHGQVD